MKTGYAKKSSGLYFQVAAGAVIIIGVLVLILLLTRSTTKETEIIFSESSVEIKGMYGTAINFNDITEVELKDTIPAVEKKTNGSGLGEIKKGFFVLEGLGECRLFTGADIGPFVYIRTDGKYVIINFKDSSKTEGLYQKLMEKWKK